MITFVSATFLGTVLAGTLAIAAPPSPPSPPAPRNNDPVELFHVFPRELFVKESSPIIFSAKLAAGAIPKAGEKPPNLTLIQVDASGKKLRYIGIMSDDGVMGDKVRGDNILTRKHQLTEKVAQKVYFAVVEETAAGVPEQVDPAKAVSIEIIRRPSFVEIVSTIWSKITSKQ